jgi:hypothetical protein
MTSRTVVVYCLIRFCKRVEVQQMTMHGTVLPCLSWSLPLFVTGQPRNGWRLEACCSRELSGWRGGMLASSPRGKNAQNSMGLSSKGKVIWLKEMRLMLEHVYTFFLRNFLSRSYTVGLATHRMSSARFVAEGWGGRWSGNFGLIHRAELPIARQLFRNFGKHF